MSQTFDLIVIGAGWSGLYAAKYARAAGLSVCILEDREDLGGVWKFSDNPARVTVMDNTLSSSSRHVTEASDFAMETTSANLFTHQEALEYLRAYARRFDLTGLIETHARVCDTEKSGDLWTVRTTDGRQFTGGRLAVCTGVHQSRRAVTGPVAGFGGHLIHAGDIKRASDLNLGPGDHVVIYGGGETAADLVHDLAIGTEARITWAIRGGQHFFRKVPLRPGQGPGQIDRTDIALDEYSSALIGLVSPPDLDKPGMRHRCNTATSGSVLSYQGHGIGVWTNDIPWFRQFFNKNGHVLDHVWNGRVDPAPAVSACDGRTLTFANRETVEATHVICCFGYQSDHGFLPAHLRDTCQAKLHRLVFHADDPSVAFFGMARPTILSIPYMIELQCMYAQKVWDGTIQLPDPETLRAEAEAEAVELNNVFGYERTNRNLTCPFWYTQRLLRLIGGVDKEADLLFRRFHPRRDWHGFSAVIRTSLTPLLLRLLVAEHGPEERRRMFAMLSPMPFGFRRKPDASLMGYVLSYAVALGVPRLLGLDGLYDRIARRRIARFGRSTPLRRVGDAPTAQRSGRPAPRMPEAAQPTRTSS